MRLEVEPLELVVGIRTAPFTERFDSTPSQVSAEHRVSLLSFVSQWSPTLTCAAEAPGKQVAQVASGRRRGQNLSPDYLVPGAVRLAEAVRRWRPWDCLPDNTLLSSSRVAVSRGTVTLR